MERLWLKKYRALTPLEIDELSKYLTKHHGYAIGAEIAKTTDNIGWSRKTLTVIACVNRAEEYHRRHRREN